MNGSQLCPNLHTFSTFLIWADEAAHPVLSKLPHGMEEMCVKPSLKSWAWISWMTDAN
jgi:hypothetical protein